MIALTMSYRMIDGAFSQVIKIICKGDKRALIEQQSWLTVCWLEVVVRVTQVILPLGGCARSTNTKLMVWEMDEDTKTPGNLLIWIFCFPLYVFIILSLLWL